MKVLFISISAPPKNAPESLQVAKYIKYLSQNHEITLVTSKITGGWRPNDATLQDYINVVNKVIELSIWGNKYVFNLVQKLFPRLLQMPDEDAPFHWRHKEVLRQMKGEIPDIIYSRGLPLSSNFLAYKLKKIYKKPWVMHLSDPWVDNPYHELKGKVLKYNQKWERILFKEASIVTLTSQKTIAHYKAKYPQLSSKFIYCPNVYDSDEISDNPINLEGKLTFVHTGRLYGSRSAEKLLEAIQIFISRNPEAEKTTEFLFAGFCDNENEELFSNVNLSCIKYLGPVSFAASLDLQRSAHILIAIDGNETSSLFGLFFPSKVLDYIVAKRKILALTQENSTTEEIVANKYGRCFRHEDIEGITNFLTTAFNKFQKKNAGFFITNEIPLELSAEYNANLLSQTFESLT